MDEVRSLFELNSNDDGLKRVRELLAAGVDPNHEGSCGLTLFHRAIIHTFADNYEVIEEYIKARADVNLGTHLAYTPLHFAVAYQKTRVIDALIRHGAAINAKDFEGRSVLHYAVTKRKLPVNTVAFQIKPKPEIIRQLLKHEDIDCNAVDSNGDTPLMVAIKGKQFHAVKMLLNHGANPNICNKLSEIPLHVAFSIKPNVAETQLILRGASISAMDKNGQTPLDIFIQNRTHEHKSTIQRAHAKYVIRTIAFLSNLTEMVMQKLDCFPELNQLLCRCSEEVLKMRIDFISQKLTVHDFILKCFNEDQFVNPLQIYERIVERLIRDDYFEYFCDILVTIPEPMLFTVLENTAKLLKNVEGNLRAVSDIFSLRDTVELISEHLDHVDIFSLIVAFSNVEIPKSMIDLHNRSLSVYCDLS